VKKKNKKKRPRQLKSWRFFFIKMAFFFVKNHLKTNDSHLLFFRYLFHPSYPTIDFIEIFAAKTYFQQNDEMRESNWEKSE
jgi:hypothetical protein